MIATPYAEIRRLAGMPDDWAPTWAVSLQVHRTDSRKTIYSAEPRELDADALAELHTLAQSGWAVTLDGPRLSRIRIRLTKETTK